MLEDNVDLYAVDVAKFTKIFWDSPVLGQRVDAVLELVGLPIWEVSPCRCATQPPAIVMHQFQLANVLVQPKYSRNISG